MKVLFDEVEIGNCFSYNGEKFVKIDPGFAENANGIPDDFDPDTLVEVDRNSGDYRKMTLVEYRVSCILPSMSAEKLTAKFFSKMEAEDFLKSHTDTGAVGFIQKLITTCQLV